MLPYKNLARLAHLQEQPTRYLGNILYPKRTKKMYDREAERKKKEEAGNK